jgi:Family of unknown function (DUF5760)
MAQTSTPEAFREVVLEYSDSLKALKDLRTRSAELKDEVLAYMRHHDIDECELRDGTKLVRATKRKTEALKKDHIASEIRRLVGTDTAVDEVVQNMLARRATGETETLTLAKGTRAKPAEA